MKHSHQETAYSTDQYRSNSSAGLLLAGYLVVALIVPKEPRTLHEKEPV